MKKILVLATVLFLFYSQTAEAAEFSSKEWQSLELIAKVKAFAPTLNLGPTSNFEKFQEGDGAYNLLYYHLKEDMPFSYLDSAMNFAECPHDNLADNRLCLLVNGVNTEDYDVFFILQWRWRAARLLLGDYLLLIHYIWHRLLFTRISTTTFSCLGTWTRRQPRWSAL